MSKESILVQLHEMAERTGSAIIYTAKNEGDVPYVYTVGHSKLGLPEVFMWAPFDQSLANSIVNELRKNWIENGVQFGINHNIARFADGSPMHVRVIAIDLEELVDSFALFIDDFYAAYPQMVSKAGISAVQVLWPDAAGLFPDEDGFYMPMPLPMLAAPHRH